MAIILAIILTFILGLNFTLIVVNNLRVLERLVLAWVIGLGLVTQLLFLLSVLNIDYSIGLILAIILISNVVAWFVAFRKRRFKGTSLNGFRNPISRLYTWVLGLRLRENFLIILILVLIVVAFVKAVFWPVYYWDALALYDYRGKIFFEAKGIAESINLSSLPLQTSPPMTSLAHTFIYLFAGKNSNPQFIYPLFYLALLITFYFSVRKYSKRWVALLFTFLLAGIPFFVEFAANAYTNLPYAFYFGMGTVYLYRFTKERDLGLLFISGTLLGLSGWTRSPTEQFLLANLIVLTGWCFWKKDYYYAPFVLLIIFSILAFPWRLYSYFVLQTPPIYAEVTAAAQAGLSSAIDFGRFFEVLMLLLSSIKRISGISLLLVFLVVLCFPKIAKKNIFLLMIIALNFFVFIAGSYFFSLSWPAWKDSITNSANRLSMFLTPFTLYYSAISIPGFLNRKGKAP